jgi:hypothetical protein
MLTLKNPDTATNEELTAFAIQQSKGLFNYAAIVTITRYMGTNRVSVMTSSTPIKSHRLGGEFLSVGAQWHNGQPYKQGKQFVTRVQRTDRASEALRAWSALDATSAAGTDNADIRGRIVADAHAFTSYGVSEGIVVLVTPNGLTKISTSGTGDAALCVFDHLPSDGQRVMFWVRKKNNAALGELLRSKSNLRRPFNDIFAA